MSCIVLEHLYLEHCILCIVLFLAGSLISAEAQLHYQEYNRADALAACGARRSIARMLPGVHGAEPPSLQLLEARRPRVAIEHATLRQEQRVP